MPELRTACSSLQLLGTTSDVVFLHQEGTTGRDHNPDGFTCWMLGAGVKGGTSYGSTDAFGRRAQEHPTTVWDFYATALAILGFDHTRLTHYHNGLDRRLTDVQGRVIRELLVG